MALAFSMQAEISTTRKTSKTFSTTDRTDFTDIVWDFSQDFCSVTMFAVAKPTKRY